jgi:signal transduction histidine kinase
MITTTFCEAKVGEAKVGDTEVRDTEVRDTEVGKAEINKNENIRSRRRLKIEVKNTGAHIPEDELEKIWDKYYRMEKSRNRKYGGNGIGLNIVANILSAHGVEYGVRNDDGVVFYFYLEVPVTSEGQEA